MNYFLTRDFQEDSFRLDVQCPQQTLFGVPNENANSYSAFHAQLTTWNQ